MKIDATGLRKEVDDLNNFRSNVKGKVAGISLFGGIATSGVVMWIKSHFFNN